MLVSFIKLRAIKMSQWCSSKERPLDELNPLHPNISMYILHTGLHTFPKVLTRRICLLIKGFFRC